MSDQSQQSIGQTQLAQHAEEVKQQYKEKAIQDRAKEMDMNYVDLRKIAINPDLAKVISKEEAEGSQVAAYLLSGKKLKVATPDLHQRAQSLVKKLRDGGYWVEVSICSEESLKAAHKIYFNSQYKEKEKIENKVSEKDLGSATDEISDLKDLQAKIESSPYDAALNTIQLGAYKVHASDIHFQPSEEGVLIRFRIDGVLQSVFSLKTVTYEGIAKEIKYLSHLKLNITNVPQDGQYGFKVNDGRINVRVSTLPTQYGEAIVMRLLDANKTNIPLGDLGFEGVALDYIQESSKLNHGMILVTGPTGSGKSTTLYAMLKLIDTQVKKVITLEDPIEFSLNGISQSEIKDEEGYGFANGLRAILRQDPDVIMLGEIRDLETAETAAQASLTGHLVLSTLHTNSAVDSIPRLINMGVKPFILAPALNLIVAQRLVRRLCSCAKDQPMDESKKAQVNEMVSKMHERGINLSSVPEMVKVPVGCDKCGQIGYMGQLVIAEVLRFDDHLRNLILENKPIAEVHDYIDQHLKMITFREDGLIKALKGYTTLEEVERVAK